MKAFAFYLIVMMAFGSSAQASQYFWNYGNQAGSKFEMKYGNTPSAPLEFLGVCLTKTADLPICTILPQL